MPAVIHPRRMRHAHLADHLRGKMEKRERLVVALDIQLGPIAHRDRALHFAVPHC